MQTKGEYRVGVMFNPSASGHVSEIKGRAAELIDIIEHAMADKLSTIDSPQQAGEVRRLTALAQTAIEDGAMWAVKAVTKEEQK